MYYVGVDLHKEQSWFFVMDKAGEKILSKSISNKPDVLNKFMTTLPKPFKLAVESTYNWYFFVDIAEQYAKEVFLANSYELKAFAKRHKKTDKIDARLIADVLRKGYLPTVTIPDKNTRKMKELLHYRMRLVQDRCRSVLRLKNLLDKLGQNSTGNFTTYKRLSTISTAGLPVNYQKIILGYTEQIEFLNRKIQCAETFLKEQAVIDEDIKNLISMPGLSYFSASLIKNEIINIERFASFNRLCAYAGLAPKVSQSGNKMRHGSLNKNRRKYLQWIIIEVVIHFIKASPEITALYEVLKKKKGYNTAKVILARRMLKIIYHILKEKRPFYFKEHPLTFESRSVAATALYGV
ncbi:MAG: IS110 family transposase [Candidatus Omnitrophota bacterium]